MLHKVVGQCPEQSVGVQGCEVRCLLDTGAQVSTLTEQCYRCHFSQHELVDISELVSVSGTQGQEVPFLGCVQLDVELAGEKFPGLWFLVNPYTRTFGDPILCGLGSEFLRGVGPQ